MMSLSQGQKKTAQYILDNLERACYQTIAQIAKETKTSETTVIRLSYSLDFPSFSEMQKAMRDSVLGSYARMVRKTDAASSTSSNPYTAQLEKSIGLMQDALRDLDMDEVDAAVQALVEADQVVIIGFRSSAAAAEWFYNVMSIIRPNVRLLTSNNDAYNILLDVTPGAVVVSITFMRYSRDTLHFTECAKSKGARIVAITDGTWSPIAPYADRMLCSGSHRIAGCFNSMLPSVILLDLLTYGVAGRSPDFEKRLAKLDEISGMLSAFQPFPHEYPEKDRATSKGI